MTVASTLLPSSFAIMLIFSIAHRALDCDDEGTLVPGIRASLHPCHPAALSICADEDPIGHSGTCQPASWRSR